MARTKASVGARISSGKSNKARCGAAPTPSPSSVVGTRDKSSRSSGNSGGNPVCPRETPAWQKPITSFFAGVLSCTSNDKDSAGPSTRKSKKRVIESDDEEHHSKDSGHQPDEDKNSKQKQTIVSDDETENVEAVSRADHESVSSQQSEELEPPKNQVLDESIILEPLTGENSHKIVEYYQFKNKGRGKKSTANKENEVVTKNIGKRPLDDVDEVEHANKKVKIAAGYEKQ